MINWVIKHQNTLYSITFFLTVVIGFAIIGNTSALGQLFDKSITQLTFGDVVILLVLARIVFDGIGKNNQGVGGSKVES